MKIIHGFIFSLILFLTKEACDNFDEDYVCPNSGTSNKGKLYMESYKEIRFQCSGERNQFTTSWENGCFQTPPRGHSDYKDSYQDMHYIVGYAQLKYFSNKQRCTIKFITKVNPVLGSLGSDYNIYYKFGNKPEQMNLNSITLNSEDDKYPNGMKISARILTTSNDEYKLELEDEYFMWDNPVVVQDGKYENGQKGVIVELFGWPYDDVADECVFLSLAGYMGVKIFPPNESILDFDSTDNDELNPWKFIYQPVSYRLESRMGNKKQLKRMINRCRSLGVRLYADTTINHMAEDGYDMYNFHKIENYYGNCIESGKKSGSAGSPFWSVRGRTSNNPITNEKPVFECPSVPYCANDFHCRCDIIN